ncbi:hypothetical protein A0H81_07300 [Grifola frondosa]|uniref:Uncharacterized protein n=1 Tax=Grifola frondosa TaxID=5627 RepID=A0A1C7M8B4_GRIFR|nr:hypothetical protein A0H81_07300 [Grifola frondosa]
MGVGADLRDNGLVRLLETMPFVRRLDLEGACDITDDLLLTNTPNLGPRGERDPRMRLPQPGHALEHLTISYTNNITNDALTRLMRGCMHLRILKADNTHLSGRARRLADTRIVVIDCRTHWFFAFNSAAQVCISCCAPCLLTQ